jgi:hypothetical protein
MHWWHSVVLKFASLRAMGRLALGQDVQMVLCLYPSGMLNLSWLYLPISWVHKQGDYAACI